MWEQLNDATILGKRLKVNGIVVHKIKLSHKMVCKLVTNEELYKVKMIEFFLITLYQKALHERKQDHETQEHDHKPHCNGTSKQYM